MNDDKCFRCGAQPKILINMTIDDKLVKLCPRCYYEHCLFLDGCVINELVHVQRDYFREEEE